MRNPTCGNDCGSCSSGDVLEEINFMDPNETWARMVRISERMVEESEDGSAADSDDAYELAEATLALRGWLAKGGFPPRAWSAKEEKL
jgi:hypothetical protein